MNIRAEICLKAAYASFCLGHEEKMMKFCWECFCSDSTEKNFLRLFGTKEMAARYGMRGKEVLKNRIRERRRVRIPMELYEKAMIPKGMYNTKNKLTAMAPTLLYFLREK